MQGRSKILPRHVERSEYAFETFETQVAFPVLGIADKRCSHASLKAELFLCELTCAPVGTEHGAENAKIGCMTRHKRHSPARPFVLPSNLR